MKSGLKVNVDTAAEAVATIAAMKSGLKDRTLQRK